MAKKKNQATWGGRFSEGPAELMQRLGESVSFDARLAPYDVQGSKAHAAMLCSVGLISKKEKNEIHKGLDAVLADITAGKFKWKTELEDVHMNIEQALTRRTAAGAKLHTARSRNDQVATDMRLFFKDACGQISAGLAKLIAALLDFAEKNPTVVIPGYTHLQRAQPVLIGHHVLAWVEMFGRDRDRFAAVLDHANWCPLGSGAIAGSTLPIDREFTARELGFVDAKGKPRVSRNSMDTVADRDTFIEFATACAMIGTHLSRVAEDMILWASAEFGFVRLADAFTTGSSLMPQKKNPDSLELIRGKAARMQGNLTTLLTMCKGLPLTYNRDLQEDKPPVFDSFDQTLLCLDVLTGTISGTVVNPAACERAVGDPLLLATDLADYLVERGMPFRDAHHAVGKLVGISEKTKTPINEIPMAKAKAAVPELGSDWYDVFDISRGLKLRENLGMPGPKQVKKQITAWRRKIS
ncbi:argininosuccinate lyase [Rubellicoccus peritrichatus]|uniref:Argininosuccinate lyase n=1 Tax=Rubellicoccus peritrichatus TaxID=3080537 RepID=A0AAQ3QU78_9BACT|nr:argininosuccinate lyase [Puniceicoccus sp. CR14]WOO39705.1 argininosuccinate lyase [Puniceicoccus sp. CR14]